MKIKEIFEKDPTRDIPGVVKVDQHSDDVVGTELEEYVMTKQIMRYTQKFIDGLLETRKGRTSDTCIWISGFFGSGKSHFAKMLGYLASNRVVSLQNDTQVAAGEYLSKKYGLNGVTILTNELRTKSFFYNVLGSDTAKETNLSRYIYRKVLLSLNFSEVPWIAEIEDSIQKDGLWDDFLTFVEETSGSKWSELRKLTVKVRPVLAKALVKLYPKLYSDEGAAIQAISDQQEEHRLNPPKLVERLVNEAERIDPSKGRILLILDEVGLYLKGDTNRLIELNSLAEEIEKVANGKIWLVVTAQESLDSIDLGAGITKDQIGWLRDRFTQKFQLDPRNIPLVVQERLLKKKDGKGIDILKEVFQKNEGQLGTACIIDDASRDSSVFKSFDWKSFKNSYPLLPYHIPVMLNIFASLRRKGRRLGQESQLAGRERAVLSVVGPILKTLVDDDIKKGSLVTFDVLYDTIESVLQIVSSDHHHLITERISEIGKVGQIQAVDAAKALFLLQQIDEWIPATARNIAAMLYPSLGTSSAKHLSNIESCLHEMKIRKWVREEGGVYRFLSEMERNFEEEVDQHNSSLLSHEVFSKIIDISKVIFKSMKNYNHRNLRVFDVTIFVDDESLFKGGPHTLRIFTPLFNANKDRTEDLVYRSMGDAKSVFWISAEDDAFSYRIRRALALRKTLDEWTRTVKTPRDLQELDSSRKELARIEDELPNTFQLLLRSGIILFGGKKHELNQKNDINDVFKEWMKEFTQQEYTRFDEAAVRVRDKDIEAALRWRGGKPPTLFKELKIVDKQGKPLLTGPVAHELMQEMKRNGATTEGGTLISRFEEPPFGWDGRTIRLVMAFLYRQSSVNVESNRESVFSKSSEFKKARFSIGTILTPEEMSAVKKHLSEIFGVTSGVTAEEISEKILVELDKIHELIMSIKTTDGFYQLPYKDELDKLTATIDNVRSTSSTSLRIRTFLEDSILKDIVSGKNLLNRLKLFIDNGCLNELQSIKSNIAKMERDTRGQYPKLENQLESLNEKMKGDIIKDWPSIYDDYVKISGNYKKECVEQHKRTQEAFATLHKNITTWMKKNKVDRNTKSSAQQMMMQIACDKGPEGNFNQDLLMCEDCKRTLPSLVTHESKANRLENEIMSMMLAKFAKQGKDLYGATLKQEMKITTQEDLQSLLRKISDFVKFWIAKGKTIDSSFEGKSLDEE